MFSRGQEEDHDSPYPAGFRERAVQVVVDHLDSCASPTAAVRDIAARPGCSPDSRRVRHKQARRDSGKEAGPTRAGKARTTEPERENRALRQANGIPKKASACLAQAELDRPFRK